MSVAIQTQRAIRISGRAQKLIAKESQITDATLSRFLSQKSDIKLSTFESILAALKIDLSGLIQMELGKRLGLIQDPDVGDVEQLLARLPKSKRNNAVEHLLMLSKGVRSQEVQELCFKIERGIKNRK